MAISEDVGASRRRERFDPGRIVVTSEATEVLSWTVISAAVERHTMGDWGEVWEERKQENEDALQGEGDRLFSIYRAGDSMKFCVVSDTRQGVTTVMLADEV